MKFNRLNFKSFGLTGLSGSGTTGVPSSPPDELTSEDLSIRLSSDGSTSEVGLPVSFNAQAMYWSNLSKAAADGSSLGSGAEPCVLVGDENGTRWFRLSSAGADFHTDEYGPIRLSYSVNGGFDNRSPFSTDTISVPVVAHAESVTPLSMTTLTSSSPVQSVALGINSNDGWARVPFSVDFGGASSTTRLIVRARASTYAAGFTGDISGTYVGENVFDERVYESTILDVVNGVSGTLYVPLDADGIVIEANAVGLAGAETAAITLDARKTTVLPEPGESALQAWVEIAGQVVALDKARPVSRTLAGEGWIIKHSAADPLVLSATEVGKWYFDAPAQGAAAGGVNGGIQLTNFNQNRLSEVDTAPSSGTTLGGLLGFSAWDVTRTDLIRFEAGTSGSGTVYAGLEASAVFARHLTRRYPQAGEGGQHKLSHETIIVTEGAVGRNHYRTPASDATPRALTSWGALDLNVFPSIDVGLVDADAAAIATRASRFIRHSYNPDASQYPGQNNTHPRLGGGHYGREAGASFVPRLIAMLSDQTTTAQKELLAHGAIQAGIDFALGPRGRGDTFPIPRGANPPIDRFYVALAAALFGSNAPAFLSDLATTDFSAEDYQVTRVTSSMIGIDPYIATTVNQNAVVPFDADWAIGFPIWGQRSGGGTSAPGDNSWGANFQKSYWNIGRVRIAIGISVMSALSADFAAMVPSRVREWADWLLATIVIDALDSGGEFSTEDIDLWKATRSPTGAPAYLARRGLNFSATYPRTVFPDSNTGTISNIIRPRRFKSGVAGSMDLSEDFGEGVLDGVTISSLSFVPSAALPEGGTTVATLPSELAPSAKTLAYSGSPLASTWKGLVQISATNGSGSSAGPVYAEIFQDAYIDNTANSYFSLSGSNTQTKWALATSITLNEVPDATKFIVHTPTLKVGFDSSSRLVLTRADGTTTYTGTAVLTDGDVIDLFISGEAAAYRINGGSRVDAWTGISAGTFDTSPGWFLYDGSSVILDASVSGLWFATDASNPDAWLSGTAEARFNLFFHGTVSGWLPEVEPARSDAYALQYVRGDADAPFYANIAAAGDFGCSISAEPTVSGSGWTLYANGNSSARTHAFTHSSGDLLFAASFRTEAGSGKYFTATWTVGGVDYPMELSGAYGGYSSNTHYNLFFVLRDAATGTGSIKLQTFIEDELVGEPVEQVWNRGTMLTARSVSGAAFYRPAGLVTTSSTSVTVTPTVVRRNSLLIGLGHIRGGDNSPLSLSGATVEQASDRTGTNSTRDIVAIMAKISGTGVVAEIPPVTFTAAGSDDIGARFIEIAPPFPVLT